MAEDRYRYFRIEAKDLLDQLTRGALDLEREPSAAPVVSRLLRVAHTLKGAARVVREAELAELAHAIEDLLAPIRGEEGPAPRAAIASVVERVDAIRARVAMLSTPNAPNAPNVHHENVVIRAEVAEVDQVVDDVSSTSAELALLRASMSELARIRQMSSIVSRRLARERSASQSMFAELMDAFARLDEQLTARIDRAERDLDQVRAGVERMRLVPASSVLDAAQRAGREAARATGKTIEIETRGAQVRLDAHVLAAASGALVQMVHNAVAHGIEPAPDRRERGKQPAGRIVIEVARRGTSHVAFTCSDDGRGVDLEEVRRAARRKSGRAIDGELGASQLLELLLEGGITTAPSLTAVAGRGVGMSVVREASLRLGGEVKVETETHQGTTVSLIVPMVRFALDALVVEVDGQRIGIPLDAVRGALRLPPDGRIHGAAGLAIETADGRVPFAALASCLGRSSPRNAGAFSAVLVRDAGHTAAFGVDRIVGVEQVVSRTLPSGPIDPIVAAIAIQPAGDPILIVDAPALVSRAASHGVVQAPREPVRLPILVIDDSLTTRMLEQSILESAGYEVELATSGEEGLAKAKQRRYGVFLVDVEMPGIDGFAFVAQTRADPELRHTPAILITSRNSREDRARGVEVGASGYFVKTEFDQRALLERIGELAR